MIFKRKSFHLFRCNTYPLTNEELNMIYDYYQTITPLYDDIKTRIEIVKADKTSCKRGEEYCILLYSQVKDNYLTNIGYIGEQLDLFLVSINIGTLWYGIAKEKDGDDLNYVIMIAIAKVDETSFRKDMFKSKRKPLIDIYEGKEYDFFNIVRYTPSACNSQPWFIESKDNKLSIYRYKKPGRIGIMPKGAASYYNRIDMGIFLLFIELCLNHSGYKYDRKLYVDDGSLDKTLLAEYVLAN